MKPEISKLPAQHNVPSRRNFLFAGGATAAGVATAVAVGPNLREQLTSATAVPKVGDGVALTEHMRKYYRTAEV